MTAEQQPAVSIPAALGLSAQRLTAVIASYRQAGMTLATAESLTAGLLAAALTEPPGASAVVRGGIVCYATDLKASLLGVDAELLKRSGPVHPQVAAQLAAGARQACNADVGVGLTGVAGPDWQGDHPPGTVFVAICAPNYDEIRMLQPQPAWPGRAQIRAAAVRCAIGLLEAAAPSAR